MSDPRMHVSDERPARLLVIAAHPGDADEALAGSAARWIGQGSIAQLVCCTSGDADAEDPRADPLEVASRREREQRAAAARVGYEAVTFLHRPDGAVANDLALREQLVRLLRSFRPEAVAAPDPRDTIRADGRIVPADVRATGEAALDAIDAARHALRFPQLAVSDGLMPHHVARLYLYWSERPTSLVDIGASLEIKVTALREHAGHPGARDLAEDARAAAASVGSRLGLSAAEECVIVDLRG